MSNPLRATGRIQEDGLPVTINCRVESVERVRTYQTKADLGGEGDAE